jgi:nascent polypeptide-associated complex subunit alpha
MMKQMGLKMNELGDVKRVIFQGSNREIVIEGPVVTEIDLQGQKMYQVAGGTVSESAFEKKMEIAEEDVILVAQQAGVNLEKAKAALENTEGDLAKAILILKTG